MRNTPHEISSLLNLPAYSFALFGLCLGYPSQVNEIKPRLSIKEIMHIDRYDVSQSNQNLIEYNQVMQDYYLNRTSNNKSQVWTEQIAQYFHSTLRPHMNSFLRSIGFKL